MFWNALQEYTEHFFADVFTPLSVKRKANVSELLHTDSHFQFLIKLQHPFQIFRVICDEFASLNL